MSFDTMFDSFRLPGYDHIITFVGISQAQHEDMLLWLIENLGQPNWDNVTSLWSYRSLMSSNRVEKMCVGFRTQEDAAVFALLWGR